MDAIDRARVLDLCDNDVDEICELLVLAVEVIQELLERTASALERSDVAGALSALHELRGSSANVGAQEVAAIAGCLEDALRTDGESDLRSSNLSGLYAACDRLVTATRKFQV